jgi:hypothetical protein
VLLVSPLLTGAAIGAMGNASDTYRGSYGLAILGAYLGAATTVPLYLLVANESGGDAKSGNFAAGLVCAAVGWLIIQPAVSIGLWHGSKHVRGAPPPPDPPPNFRYPGRLPAGPTRGLSRLPGELTAPLLSLSF